MYLFRQIEEISYRHPSWEISVVTGSLHHKDSCRKRIQPFIPNGGISAQKWYITAKACRSSYTKGVGTLSIIYFMIKNMDRHQSVIDNGPLLTLVCYEKFERMKLHSFVFVVLLNMIFIEKA
jgi:hypothetical protein